MSEKQEMTFLDHLEALRWHLIRSVIAIMAGAIIIFIFKDFFFNDILLAPKNPDFITNKILCLLAQKYETPSICINQNSFQLISISMSGQFNMHMFVSLIGGIILAFPYVFWELWRFISPALNDKERKHASGAIFYISTMFFVGILFGYYIITPFSVDFLGSYSVSDQISNQINIASYISTLVSVTFASGLVFELPIIVFFLSSIGILTPQFMRKYRRHSFVVILIVSAIITPPDVFSQILVTMPLYLLYEISIIISVLVVRKKKLS